MLRHTEHLRRALAAAAVATLMGFAPAAVDAAPKPEKKAAPASKSAPARDKAPAPGAAKPAGGLEADQVAALLDVLQLYNPAMAERLVSLRDSNQEQFHKTAVKLYSSFSKQIRLKKNDPQAFAIELEEYQLQKQVDQLTDKLKKQPDQREAIIPELRAALDQRELARIRGREHELAQFEKKLIPLRQALADQQARQSKQIDQRLALLLSDKFDIGPAVRLVNKPEKQDMVVTAKPALTPPPAPAPGTPPTIAAPPAPAPGKNDQPAKPDDASEKKPEPQTKQTAEDKLIDQVLEVIHAARPALAERLTELRSEDPKVFDQVIKQLGGRFRTLIQKKKNDPEGFAMQIEEYRLNLEAMELAASMRQMPANEADKLKPQLRVLIEQQFQAHQQLMQHELGQMEKRFESLRSDIERDRRTKDERVDQRLKRLLADGEK